MGRRLGPLRLLRRPWQVFLLLALSLGLVAGAKLAGLDLFLGSYPITPASPVLHALARLKEFGVTSFQAEDEIAAIGYECTAVDLPQF